MSEVPALRKLLFCLITVSTFVASRPVLAEADHVAEAKRLLQSGKYEEAANSFGAILATNPQSAGALAGRTRALLKQDKVAESLEAAKAASASLPNNPLIHTVLGEVYFRKAWIPEADEEFRRALKLDAKLARAWLGLGRIAHLVSKHKTAKEYLERAYGLDPDDPDVLYHWQGTLKSVSEQTSALERYLKLAPYEEAERLDRIRDYIEIRKQLGDRKLSVLASGYVKSEIPLQLLMHDGRHAKGFGLRVSVNGGKAQTLMLDTGASGIIIGRKQAEKSGVKRLIQTNFQGLGDKGPLSGYTGLADRLRIGDVEFRDVVVGVSDEKSVAGEAGLIGTDVFEKFLVTLDFAERVLRLDPLPKRQDGGSDDDPYDRVIYPEMKDFAPVYIYGHNLLITTTVDEAPPAVFLIDTGTTANFISTELARTVAKVYGDQRTKVRGISGAVKNVYRADRLTWQFSRFRQEARDVISLDFAGINKKVGLEISGILGIPMLVRFDKIAINYRDGLVNFEYKR